MLRYDGRAYDKDEERFNVTWQTKDHAAAHMSRPC